MFSSKGWFWRSLVLNVILPMRVDSFFKMFRWIWVEMRGNLKKKGNKLKLSGNVH